MAPGDLQEVLAGAQGPAGVSAQPGSAGRPRRGRRRGRLPPDARSGDRARPSTSSRRWSTTRGRGAPSPPSTPCRTSTPWAGEVLFALAVAGFPRDMTKTIITEVFRGRRREGGRGRRRHRRRPHRRRRRAEVWPLRDRAASHPDRILIKGGLRPGDRLFLSKPLGTGVITTAAKNESRRRRTSSRAPWRSMLRLNRVAAARRARVRRHAAPPTSRASGSSATPPRWSRPPAPASRFSASRLPLLPGALALAEAGSVQRRHGAQPTAPGRDLRRRGCRSTPAVPAPLASMLTEAETSGGLLFSVAPDRAGGVIEAFRAGPGGVLGGRRGHRPSPFSASLP